MGTIAEMAFAPSSANVGLLNLDTSSADAASARDLRSMQIQEKAIANQAAQEKQAKQQYLMQYFKQNGISEDSIKNYGATTGDVETTQVLLENYQEQQKRLQEQEKAKQEISKLKNESDDFEKEKYARLARGIDLSSLMPTTDDKGNPIPQTPEQREKQISTEVRLGYLFRDLHLSGKKTPWDPPEEGKFTSPDQIDITKDYGKLHGWLETLKQTGTPVKEQINEVNKDEDQAFREKQLSSTASHQTAVLENTIENQKTQNAVAASRLSIEQEKLSLERQREEEKRAQKKKEQAIEKSNKISSYDQTISIIDDLASNEGTTGIVGMKNAASVWGLLKEPIAGTKEADAKTMYDALVSRMTMENMGVIKGTLSDSDMKLLRSASSTLSRTSSDKQFMRELQRVKNFYEKAKYNLVHDIYYEGDKVAKDKNYNEDTDTIKSDKGNEYIF